ncbi:MAG: hypothetical protein AABY15_02670 [Nanoarchaeota archaeon]
MDYKSAEVVTTLSHHYGNDSLIDVGDTVFVTHDEYNLYYDSLSLWYITKDAYKDNSSSAKSTLIGGFSPVEYDYSTAQWIKIFDKATRDAYAANGNTTAGNKFWCIPSTYSNLSLFYEKESKYIKSYNNGRIKVYQYQATTDYDSDKYDIHIHDTINFYLAFHKTIQPVAQNAVQIDIWIPYTYIYAKPVQVVYEAPVSKLWEIKTGLPYSVAAELGLTEERVPIILEMLGIINDEVLIKETVPELEVDSVYNIYVNCDTCDVKFYDNRAEDKDIIDFTYSGSTQRLTIRNTGTNYKIVLSEDNSFYIFAVSEGYLETCTVNAIIDGSNHIFALRKDERVLIKLNKL